MTPEGMVHALDEIHRLLEPKGVLIDIHPVHVSPIIEVHQGGRLLFAQPSREIPLEAFLQADNALAQAVHRRLFAVEQSDQFDFLTYGSSAAELRDFLIESGAYDDSPEDEAVEAHKAEVFGRAEAVRQAAGQAAEIATHERVHIARLSPMT